MGMKQVQRTLLFRRNMQIYKENINQLLLPETE
jgi:hypothetical protein